jgi:hypothetical protein
MQFNTTRLIKEIKTLTKITKLKPPEIIYMSLSTVPVPGKISTLNQIPLGPSNALQTSLSPLYNDAAMKIYIGDCMSSTTIFNYLAKTSKYSSTASTVFKMEKGDIGVSHAPFLKKMANHYDLLNNAIEIAPIVFGTGAYLNASGFVAIASGTSTLKMILIFATV